MRTRSLTAEDRAAISEVAGRLGIDPLDLTKVMYFESAGTMNPDVVGGAGNRYQGLIQFGPGERKAYGFRPGMTVAEQVRGPVFNYLSARGLKPGARLAQIYDKINPGGGKFVPQIEALSGKAAAVLGSAGAPMAYAPAASGQAVTRTLAKGSRGPAVSQLQQQLAAAGLYKGKVDGSYGPQTAAAVRAAESTYGLTRDKGIAGPQVQAALAGTGATQDITSTFGLAPPGGPADMPGFDPVANGLGHAPGGYAPPPTDPSFMHGPPSYGQGISAPMPQPYGSVPAIGGGDALHAPISMLGAPPVMPGQFMGGEPSQGPGLPPGLSSADLSFTPHSLNSGVARGAPYPAPPVGPQIAAAPQSAPGGPPLALPASLPYRGSPPYSGFGPTLGAPSAEEAAAMARNRDREVTAVRHVPDFTSEYATPFHQPARPITPTPDWMQRQDAANAGFGNELVNGIGNFFGGSAPAAAKPNLYDVAPSAVPDSNRFTPTDITPYLPVTGQQSSIGGFPQIASADPNFMPSMPTSRGITGLGITGGGMLNHQGGMVDLPTSFGAPGGFGDMIVGGGSTDFLSGGAGPDHLASFGPTGGQPGVSIPLVRGDPGYVIGGPGPEGSMPFNLLTPPRPASLDVSLAGSPQDRARQAISDAARAAGITGAPSGGNSSGGIVPSQSYGGSPGAYSFSGFSPWGSATYNAPYGQTGYSNSPFTPSGYNAPDFNSSSGGATYSWQADPNNPGHGTYYNSSGQKLSF